MKTQISRHSHRPEKRYSGVYQQQGRMITDADWNELMEVVKERLDGALGDVVASGAPRERGAEVQMWDSGLRLVEGNFYADGSQARLAPAPGVELDDGTFGIDEQADFPGAPKPEEDDADYLVYADVWERPVTSLEDAELRDPALHGADTTTRTRTMAQVKWRPDPGGGSASIALSPPPLGDAELTLKLLAAREEADPDDPCATVVSVEERGSDYLFRLEVDDVVGAFDHPGQITLKWSRENGAEQHLVPELVTVEEGEEPPPELPPEFKAGDWVFEFFNHTCEAHPGVHQVPGFAPERGFFVEGYPQLLPAEVEDRNRDRVRRWDGYCVLELVAGKWTLDHGWDRGQKLLKSSVDPQRHGLATFKAGVVNINLETLELSLTLAGRTFVAGDYWLALVREGRPTTGGREGAEGDADGSFTAQRPVGIRHHYLRLAAVDPEGQLEDLSTAESRRLSFPPLTDLGAGDIGYQARGDCANELFDGGHDTVERALHRLCELAAEHVAYQTDCPSGLFTGEHDTVKKALDQVCDIGAEHVDFEKPCDTSLYQGANVATVAQALGLLCDIRAQHIRYTKPNNCPGGLLRSSDNTVQKALSRLCHIEGRHIAYQHGPEDCADLAAATTVHEALNVLCERPSGGGGCRVTVGRGGEFENLKDAIQALNLSGQRDICLCLLPGEHVLATGINLDAQPGPGIPGIDNLLIEGCGPATQILLETRPLQFLHLSSFSLERITVRSVHQPTDGLVLEFCRQVRIASCHFVGLVNDQTLLRIEGADRIQIVGNVFEAYASNVFDLPHNVLEPIAGAADLFVLGDTAAFLNESLLFANEIQGLDQSTRERLLEDFDYEHLKRPEKDSYERFAKVLGGKKVTTNFLVAALRGIRAAATVERAGTAVAVLTAGAATMLDENDITGLVSFYGPPTTESFPQDRIRDLMEPALGMKWRDLMAGQNLVLRNNRLTRLVGGQDLIDSFAGTSESEFFPFDTALITDNVIEGPDNHFVAVSHSLTSTRFLYSSGGDGTYLGFVYGRTAVYTANHGFGGHLLSVTQRDGIAEAATLGLEIVSFARRPE